MVWKGHALAGLAFGEKHASGQLNDHRNGLERKSDV
jgi:hypothetical protein